MNIKTRYYLKIPLGIAHQGHPIGESSTIGHYIDKRIITKINDLVKNNITNLTEVKRCLSQYVDENLFQGIPTSKKPKQSNRRYYPTRKDLRNQVAKALTSFKRCGDDQESLAQKIKEWQHSSPNSNFFYRTRDQVAATGESKVCEQSFLFVHQEPWQQRLLARYGQELCFMDATYKTTRYAIPLFFLCVHTNVGYKVVAEFMCQTEDQVLITEALSIIKKWNPSWSPKFFMVDYSTAEIGALEEVFKGIEVYICDFHRLQAQQRWSRAGKNGLSPTEKELFMAYMNKITYARTEDDFRKKVAKLKESHLYKSKAHVQRYVETTWLSCASRWAFAYRKRQATNIANTNNGTEAQNRLFKYDYLPRSIDKSIFGIAVMIVESFIPDSYQHYLDLNLRLSDSYRKYHPSVPAYLHNRPPHFVKHCMRSRFAAEEFQEKDVLPSGNIPANGVFSVASSSKSKLRHVVDFSLPSCTCESWMNSHFLCKHFYAVMKFHPQWNFSSLPACYKNSVFLTLDTGHLPSCKARPQQECSPPPTPLSPPRDNPEKSNEGKVDERSLAEAEATTNAAGLSKTLQSKVKLLLDTSYILDDIGALKEAIKRVDDITSFLKSHCSFHNGLPLRSSPTKKKLKITSSDYHKVFHKQLPPRRRWKKKPDQPPIVIDLSDDDSDYDNAVDSGKNETASANDGRSPSHEVDLSDGDGYDGERSGKDESARRENEKVDNKKESSSLHQHAQSQDDQQRATIDEQLACNAVDRLINVSGIAVKPTDKMLQIGPANLTVNDLWTLIPPVQLKTAMDKSPNLGIGSIIPGWLSDMVLDKSKTCRYFLDPANDDTPRTITRKSQPSLARLINNISSLSAFVREEISIPASTSWKSDRMLLRGYSVPAMTTFTQASLNTFTATYNYYLHNLEEDTRERHPKLVIPQLPHKIQICILP
ncbi:hypothetical protein AC249_AIPGENE11456 [Exaiptasia diaphana]|nr:hypothetical protein AC249_AIPGENE11456 [Exaiptasia diaphana]